MEVGDERSGLLHFSFGYSSIAGCMVAASSSYDGTISPGLFPPGPLERWGGWGKMLFVWKLYRNLTFRLI